MTTMHGTPEIPFSVMFNDTLNTHGTNWAYRYYVRQHKMPEWEFWFWVGERRLT